MYYQFFRILLLLFFTATTVFSQENGDFFSIDENLNGRPISDFIVDKHGYIWVGSFGGGVYRYDGVDYDHYERKWQDSTSLSSNFIRVLFEDERQTLWAGTDNGISVFDPIKERFHSYTIENEHFPSPAFTVFDIKETNDNRLILGTDLKGIVLLSPDSKKSQYLSADVFSDERSFDINKIVTLDKQYFYLGTGQGLFSYDLINNVLVKLNFDFIPEDLLGIGIQSLYLDDKKNLWIGTIDQGLLYINFKTRSYKHIPLTNTRIMDIVISGEDLFIASENDGLFIFKNQNIEKPPLHLEKQKNRHSLASNSIWTLEAIGQGRLLLGYYQFGMGLYDPSFLKFKELKHSNIKNEKYRVSFNSVNGISKIEDDLFWIGMDGRGLAKYKPSTHAFEFANNWANKGYKGMNSGSIQTTFIDSKDNLWVGTWEMGIYFLPKGSKTFQWILKENVNGVLKSNRVLSFAEDKSGRIWIATFGNGIHYFDPETKKFHHCNSKAFEKDDLYKKNIRSVFIDSKNNLWIGSSSGLYKVEIEDINDLKVEAVEEKAPFNELRLKSNNILSIYEDKAEQLWIGTDGGGVFCYNFNNNEITAYDEETGISQSVICGIVEDNLGNIWLSGKNGVSSINKANNLINNYSKKEGLISNNFNYNAIYFDDHSGQVYLGNVLGLNSINPSTLRERKNEREILNLKGLKIFNKKVFAGEESSPLEKPLNETEILILKPEHSIFTIEYAGVDFPYSDRLKYAYYLEGLEEDWNNVGKRRSVTYTSLNPGDYVFHLKKMNIYGDWSGERTLKIKVLPHWYQSTLAILLYILTFLLGLGVLSFLMRIRLKEKEAIKAERAKRIQEKEISQAKMQFFTNISHEFRTPLTLILNPITDLLKKEGATGEQRERYNSVYRNAMRLKQLIDELMDFRKLAFKKMKLKVQKVNVRDVANEVVLFFNDEAKNKGILLQIEDAEVTVEAYLDVKMVEKILFNLLSNSLKLTPEGGEIIVHINQKLKDEKEYMVLSVSDTGIGMTEEEVKNIFTRFYQVEKHQKAYYGGTGIGLEVVQEFVKLHHGEIQVESIENEGTTFHLYFPMGKNHFKEEQIFESNILNRNKYLVLDDIDQKKVAENLLVKAEDIDLNTTVLIVEDNYDLRKYLTDTLGVMFKVITASDGEIGLRKAREEKIDIVLSDIMMPNMDGFELCKKLKGDIQTSHIPIILLTAKNNQNDRIKGIDLGADAYLQKPFDLELLRATINQMITSRRILLKKFVGGFSENKDFHNTTSVDKDFLQQISKHVYENISDPNLNVEVLADKLKLSRSQLYRKIKALTGLSATVFIRRIRLEEGKKLIKNGNSNISEVCYNVGFSSPSYFTKCYREYFDTLPTEELKSEIYQ